MDVDAIASAARRFRPIPATPSDAERRRDYGGGVPTAAHSARHASVSHPGPALPLDFDCHTLMPRQRGREIQQQTIG